MNSQEICLKAMRMEHAGLKMPLQLAQQDRNGQPYGQLKKLHALILFYFEYLAGHCAQGVLDPVTVVWIRRGIWPPGV